MRSRLRKASSRSPSKPLVKLRPDPQPHSEQVVGLGHYSPPARLETTVRKEETNPPLKEDTKTKQNKGKEKEAPKLVRAKTDHTKCVEDTGWRPPAPVVRDHTRCIEDSRPAKAAVTPRSHNKCLEEPRGRARDQPVQVTRETPRDHTSRPIRTMSTDHECEWKDKYITLQADVDAQGRTGDIGLEGLTIVLHMQGRDDLVINTDLRNLE